MRAPIGLFITPPPPATTDALATTTRGQSAGPRDCCYPRAQVARSAAAVQPHLEPDADPTPLSRRPVFQAELQETGDTAVAAAQHTARQKDGAAGQRGLMPPSCHAGQRGLMPPSCHAGLAAAAKECPSHNIIITEAVIMIRAAQGPTLLLLNT